METDWELKDRRIAWMNINSSCANIISARIQAGLYKPKDNKAAMQELLDAIGIEFTAFGDIQSHGKEQAAMHPPVSSPDNMNRVCEDCQAKITESEANYSLKFYGMQLCRDCQTIHKRL